MVKGKSVYIYTLEENDYSRVNQSRKCGHNDCYCCKENVKVANKEYIEDAYREFKKYIDKKEFNIVKSENIPNKEK